MWIVVIMMMFVLLGLGATGQISYVRRKREAERDIKYACTRWRTDRSWLNGMAVQNKLKKVHIGGWNLDQLDIDERDKHLALELGPWRK